MSWLIRESFGIAAGFVLNNGWIVTNFIGIVVLLNIFVMLHVIAALMSFRMVALLPHHLPRLVGFTAANRVDMESFSQRAAWVPGGQVAAIRRQCNWRGCRRHSESISAVARRTRWIYLWSSKDHRDASGDEGGMDTTLRATTDSGHSGRKRCLAPAHSPVQ